MQADAAGHLSPGDYSLSYVQNTLPKLFDAVLEQKQLFNLDSSLFKPGHWVAIAEEIKHNYYDYDGFVIVHGTDSMAYTACALSFFLENLSKPVVLTGSQLPLNAKRSDAFGNLVSAVELALYSECNEVMVQFANTAFRGNRVKKKDAWDFDAFYSPNYRNLAKLGITMECFKERYLATGTKAFNLDTRHDPSVHLAPIFPGYDYMVLTSAIESGRVKGLVIEAYGSGNVPSDDPGLKQLFFTAATRDIPIVVCSQSPIGRVDLGLYKAASDVAFYGLISAMDMTREASIVKLMVALGRYTKTEDIKAFMQKSIAGEIEPGK